MLPQERLKERHTPPRAEGTIATQPVEYWGMSRADAQSAWGRVPGEARDSGEWCGFILLCF